MERKHKRTMLIGVALAAILAARPAFGLLTDMAGHWSAPLVGALEAQGIVSGDELLRFNPDVSLTRSQLAKLLVAGLGFQDNAHLLAGYPSRFTDVPKWHWANGFVEALAETGAVDGFPDGTFAPEETVTRAQMAVIFVRVAGLSEQARLQRFEQTGYADDADVPEWARGSVRVARTAGLMAGFEDNTFRPLRPVTRAEGGVALLRLLSQQGRAFHLTGTLVRFDQDSLTAVVRDPSGQNHTLTMDRNAQYFRGGLVSFAGQVRPLDQVWIVLNAQGRGAFMDARYREMVGSNLHVDGSSVTVTAPNGATRSVALQSGAMVFLNGRPARATALDGATDGYLVLDSVSGEVTVLDGLTVTAGGLLIQVDQTKTNIAIQSTDGMKTMALAPDTICTLNGDRTDLLDLRTDDRVRLVQGADGTVIYVMAER